MAILAMRTACSASRRSAGTAGSWRSLQAKGGKSQIMYIYIYIYIYVYLTTSIMYIYIYIYIYIYVDIYI